MAETPGAVPAVIAAPALRARLTEWLAFRRDPRQIAALDGLRALAIVLVLLRHAWRPFEDSFPHELPVIGRHASVFMANGWTGVDLFFVLSGFLIARHILRVRERTPGAWQWRPYLTGRVLRIVPAYYAVLFLVLAGAFPGYAIPGEYLGIRVVYHLLFLQDYLPANFVVAFWSLGVEEKFYLLAPPLVLLLMRQATPLRRMLLLGVLLAGAVGLRTWSAYTAPGIADYDTFFYRLRSPFHVTLDPLIVGVALAVLHEHRARYPRLTSPKAATLAFCGGVALFLALAASHDLMGNITTWDKSLQPLVIAVAFGAIVFGVLFAPAPAAMFRGFAFLVLARLSYTLYLVHLPLIPVALVIAGGRAGLEPQFPAFVAVWLVLSLTAALLLHYGVEKPFLHVKATLALRG